MTDAEWDDCLRDLDEHLDEWQVRAEKSERELDDAVRILRDLRQQYKLFVTEEDAIAAYHLARSAAVIAAYDAKENK